MIEVGHRAAAVSLFMKYQSTDLVLYDLYRLDMFSISFGIIGVCRALLPFTVLYVYHVESRSS